MAQLFLGLAFSLGYVAVGVFSYFVVDSTNLQILVESPYCGPLKFNTMQPDYYSRYQKLRVYEANVAAMAKAYAEDYHRSTGPRPTRCNTFTRPNIPLKKENRVPLSWLDLRRCETSGTAIRFRTCGCQRGLWT